MLDLLKDREMSILEMAHKLEVEVKSIKGTISDMVERRQLERRQIKGRSYFRLPSELNGRMMLTTPWRNRPNLLEELGEFV